MGPTPKAHMFRIAAPAVTAPKSSPSRRVYRDGMCKPPCMHIMTTRTAEVNSPDSALKR